MWAAPGEQHHTPAPASPAFPRASQTTTAPVQEPDAAESPRPLPMRPLTVLEVLDSGFAFVRSRPSTLLSIVAVLQMPLAVVGAYLNRDALDTSFELNFTGMAANSGSTASDLAPFLVAIAGSFVHALVAMAFGLVAAAWYSETDLDLGTILLKVLRRWHVVFAAWALVHLLEVVGLIGLGIGSLLTAVTMVVVVPVVALEDAGPLTAIRRSFRLVRGRFAPSLGFFIFSWLISLTIGMVLGFLPTMAAAFLVGYDNAWILLALGSVISNIGATSFSAAATIVFYLDLRIRREGLDIHMSMLQRFDG